MEENRKKRKTCEENVTGNEDGNKDDGYFQSYGLIQCHQTMLCDKQRTLAFKLSLLRSHMSLYKKTVLEIGCGTGILSIFACQAGAKRIYAIEASPAVKFAKRVLRQNEYSDRILVIHSKIEDFNLKPEEKVDAIISEWMGYTLFSEWMLPSVISTRDRMLKENGLMFPNKITMHMALAKETSFLKSRAEYWRKGPMSDYKVDMSALVEEEYNAVYGKIAVHIVEPTWIVSSPQEILCLDLNTIPFDECNRFTSNFRLTAFGSCEVYGFCLWFRTYFPGDVDFDTSPFCDTTHWQQSVLYVKPFSVKQDSVVHGSITFYRHKKYIRVLAIDLKYTLDDDKETSPTEIQFLEMLEA